MDNKITLLLDSSGPGGIETHVLELARGLKVAGVSVEVCFLKHHGEHPLHQLLEQQQIKWRSLDGRFNTLRHYLKTEQPMLLHTHGYKAGIMGRFAACLASIPVVNTDHAGDPGTGLLRLYTFVDRWSSYLNKANIAVSQNIADKIRAPATVMKNFVQLPSTGAKLGQQVAFVGRLSKEKGADIYIELARLFPEEKFYIYGDGPMMSELQGLAENVVFKGQQHSMKSVWPDIGLLVMTSRNEGLPMAALEAMAHGIPVLTSNVGDLSHLVEAEKNGWLVDKAEAGAFVQPLNNWINMDGRQHQVMACHAVQTIKETYSPAAVIPKVIDIYRTAGAKICAYVEH